MISSQKMKLLTFPSSFLQAEDQIRQVHMLGRWWKFRIVGFEIAIVLLHLLLATVQQLLRYFVILAHQLQTDVNGILTLKKESLVKYVSRK